MSACFLCGWGLDTFPDIADTETSRNDALFKDYVLFTNIAIGPNIFLLHDTVMELMLV
jgi:hypothetical protein